MIRGRMDLPFRSFGTSFRNFINIRLKATTAFDRKPELKEFPVFKYAGENRKRQSRVYSWGYCESGALGVSRLSKPRKKSIIKKESVWNPVRVPFADFVEVKHIACGYGFTVLCDRFTAYGTGNNSDSQIGYHETRKGSGKSLELVLDPVKIALPFEAEGTSKILDASCGRAHTVILSEEGVFTLGNNSHGQCGRTIIEDEVYRDSQVISRLTDVPKDITKVVCGLDTSFLLSSDGRALSFGCGTDGQLGLGKIESSWQPQLIGGDIHRENIVQLATSNITTIAINDAGDLFGWGNAEHGQLLNAASSSPQVSVPRHIKVGKNVGKITQVAIGSTVAMALNDRNEVFVWGVGTLGLGPECARVPEPTRLPPTLLGRTVYSSETDARIRRISCGPMQCSVVTSSGLLYSWGRCVMGSLGLGSRSNTQYFPFRVSVPVAVKEVCHGIDHTVVLGRSFI